MKFYITIEGIHKIKKSFLNLKMFSVINVPEIIEQYGYTYSTIDNYSSFIINKKIIDLIKCYTRSKRIRGIIYSNPYVNENIIEGLYDILNPFENISDIVLLDDYNVPKLKHLYNSFDEIIFFPSIKKIRLIECKEIKDLVEWKI